MRLGGRIADPNTGNGRSGGQEYVRLIAIDYHAATGTARMECKGDQRSKVARWLESRMDSGGLTRDTGVRGLDQARDG